VLTRVVYPAVRAWRSQSVSRLSRVARKEEGLRGAARGVRDDWLFNSRLYAPRRQRVLCLGDSHVKVMRQVPLPEFWFRPMSVRGATASGVTNPNSATRAMAIFAHRLRRAKRWQRVLIQLGEVDCGFVIWHRARRLGVSVEEQLATTLESYAVFLEGVASMGFREVVVLSVPAPTIPDDPDQYGRVANLRSEVSATQRERSDLTVRFNEQLRVHCDTLGVTFVDVTSQHIDPETNLVSPAYLRRTNDDHHLADRPYAALIGRELGALWSP
jgi:hypothetical protein